MGDKLKAHAALIGTNIFFAINFTAVKYLFNGSFIKPFGLNFIRILITTILLWILYIFKQNKVRIDKSDFFRLLICALTGIVINQLMFIKGLSMTYSIHASLLMLTTPILIVIIAAIMLKEGITVNKTMGLFLGVIGAGILITNRQNNGNGYNVLLGDVLVILNAVSYSFYFIMVKPLMKKYESLTVIRILFTMGLFIALPFCWNEFNAIPWNNYTYKEFEILGLIIVGGTFFAYLFNVYGIKHLGPSVSGSYIYSQPVFATIIAILFLNETLEWYKVVAGILIFSGVYLANKIQRNV
jgi:drug/metabolite transporter (DMT)-like permease